MAVIIAQTLPAGVPIEMLDAVTDEMGVDTNPPDGLIVHTHFEKDGQVQILDVWDSADHHQRFVQGRLQAAMGKVAAARGLDLPAGGPPESTIEVHRFVRGASR